MIEGIIFDLDGTLLDTIGGIAYSCNQALEKHGYKTHDPEDFKIFVGNGVVGSVYNALPVSEQRRIDQSVGEDLLADPHLKAMVGDFVTCYENHPVEATKFFDGIEAMLEVLKSLGIPWGIHTNKRHSITQKVVDTFWPKEAYVEVFGPSEDIPRKPDPTGALKIIDLMADGGKKPNPANMLYVGDTGVDINTAAALGMPMVAVTWGFRSKDYLKSLSPAYMVDSPKALADLVEALNQKG